MPMIFQIDAEDRPRLQNRNPYRMLIMQMVLERFELMRCILRIGGMGALIVVLFLSAVWANLAIAYQLPGSAAVRIGACLILNLIALAALVAVVRRRYLRA